MLLESIEDKSDGNELDETISLINKKGDYEVYMPPNRMSMGAAEIRYSSAIMSLDGFLKLRQSK